MVTINTKQFKDTCKVLAKLKSNLPICEAVRFSFDTAGDLHISRYNLDIWLETRLAYNTDIASSVYIVDGDLLKGVQRLKGDTCELSFTEGNAVISSGKVSLSFKLFDVEDYPEQSLHDTVFGSHCTTLDTGVLKVVSHYASKSEARTQLNGVCFDLENNAVVGCDGHRLTSIDAHFLQKDGTPGLDEKQVILPLYFFTKVLNTFKGNATFYFGDIVGEATARYRHVNVIIGQWNMYVRTVNASYPMWKQVRPSEDNLQLIEFDSVELLELLDIGKVLKCNSVAVETVDGASVATVSNAQTDNGSSLQLGDLGLCDGRIGYNPEYLLQVVKESEGTLCGLIDPDGKEASIFHNDVTGGETLVMPFRV